MNTISKLLTTLTLILSFQSISQTNIVVKFNYSKLDLATIDKVDDAPIRFGSIFNEGAIDLLYKLREQLPEVEDLYVQKIFTHLKTTDTVSYSRLGHKVNVPPFWACFRIHIPYELSLDKVFSAFKNSPSLIDYVHLDFEVEPLNVPNDEFYSQQLSLHDPSGVADINVEEAWEIETGKPFIKVGIHDNGIDSIHPDIKLLGGGAYWNNGLNNQPDFGTEVAGIPHGTPVAGIIAARRNNETGIAGIAGGDGSDSTGCSILDFKFPFLTYSGASYMLASVVDAARVVETYFNYGENYYFDYEDTDHFYYNSAKGFGVHIGNHSYIFKTTLPTNIDGEGKNISDDSTSIINVPDCDLCREAFLFSLQNGVINVVARGNNGFDDNDPTYIDDIFPQSAPDGWIISVGASGVDGNTIQDGVNQDPADGDFYSLYGGNMDIIAPGSRALVYSAVGSSISDEYRPFNGSSASAPHAAGVAALLLSHHNKSCYSNKNLSIEDVEYILQESATDLNDPGYDELSGWGRLNAGEALKMIENPTLQIVHPDSLISSVFLAEDTILLAYHQAFVGDGWGPISQAIPLERERQYKVVRVLVENTYSIDEFISPATEILDAWPRPSASNSTEFYRDTIHQLVPIGNTGNETTGYNFKIFNQTPFDSITEVNLVDRTIKVVGYYYRFIGIYFESDYNVSGENAISIEEPVINNAEQLDVWYPANPLNNNARITASIYIKDTTLLSYFDSPCDSSNILYDDTIISNPLGLNEEDLFSVKAFPNPASQSITFKVRNSGKQHSISVTDLTGRVVFNAFDIPTQFEIDISQWKAGMYLVTFDFVETKKTLKFIKQ